MSYDDKMIIQKKYRFEKSKTVRPWDELFCKIQAGSKPKGMPYPFTPPWMTPFSILSWKKGKAMMIGAMAAMMTANWIR